MITQGSSSRLILLGDETSQAAITVVDTAIAVHGVPQRLPSDNGPSDLPAGTHFRRLTSVGTFSFESVHYMVDGQRAFQKILVIADSGKLIVTDMQGEILIEHNRPAPGVKYVGNGHPPGGRKNR